MSMSVSAIRSNPAASAALIVAGGGIAAILGAYYFQYGLGLAPCPLCIDQRIVYYVAIPFALVVALVARSSAPRTLVVGGLALLLIAMLIGAAIGVYHSGVEWKFWPGPRDCSGPITNLGNAGSLLTQMEQTSIVRCDEAAWRFLGLSLAGYNVIVSLALAAVALWGIFARREKP